LSTGALISYTDTEAATATFTIQRPVVGAIKGSGHSKRCAAMPKHPKKGTKHCTLYRSLGSFTHVDVAGANRVRFTGRLRNRKLAAGRYRLLMRASANGLTSGALTKSFRIAR
ncbi:MAG TPA: hypothetical protein VNR42_01890, partial [Solirubrobacteraceae bacterium]|nr:hypothetical protein [Solirubrobacteraceae bacterium]